MFNHHINFRAFQHPRKKPQTYFLSPHLSPNFLSPKQHQVIPLSVPMESHGTWLVFFTQRNVFSVPRHCGTHPNTSVLLTAMQHTTVWLRHLFPIQQLTDAWVTYTFKPLRTMFQTLCTRLCVLSRLLGVELRGHLVTLR